MFDTVGKRPIGSLDQRFIGDYGENGNIFVLKGHALAYNECR